MSIIKNSRDVTTDITIKRFVAGQNINSDGYKPYEYIGLNDSHMETNGNKWKTDINTTILIKCEIGVNVNGRLFGADDGLSIRTTVSGGANNVIWRNGTTDLHSIAVPSGVHVYGFIKTTTGVSPFFDGQTVGTEVTSSVTTRSFILGCASNSSGSATGDNFKKSNASYALTVYEVAGRLLFSGDSKYHDVHWYATKDSSNNTRMYETRAGVAIADSVFSPVLGSQTYKKAEAVNAVTYGVQLHDIKTLTGSGYNDLLGIVMEDGGIDAKAGWNASIADNEPSELVNSGATDVRSFAFFIGLGTSSGSTIPFPSGWTATKGGSTSYEVGELIKGRKPKWDIWNDAIKFGFHVRYTNKYILDFNILKIINTQQAAPVHSTINGKAWLDWFENFNTSVDCSHSPKITVSNNTLDCYIYNGAFTQCLVGDYMAGTNINSAFVDNKCVFLLNENVGGSVNFRAGNLCPWNYTHEEIARYGYSFDALKMSVTFPSESYELFNATEQAALQGTSPNQWRCMCADSLQTDKDKFRINGIDASLSLTGKNKWYLLDRLLSATGNQITLEAKMNLMMNTDAVDCSNLVPTKTFTAQGHFDKKINSLSTNFRVVADLTNVNTSGVTNLVAVAGRNDYSGTTQLIVPLELKYVATGMPYYSCMFLPIMRCTVNSSNEPSPVYDATTDSGYQKYFGLVEVYTKTVIGQTEQYHHYMTFVKSMNGVQAFKNYCDYGSPTASSRLSGWTQREDMMRAFWGSTTAEDHNRKRVWYKSNSSYFPTSPYSSSASSEVQEQYAKTPQSVRFLTVPRKLLWQGDGTDYEYTDNTTFVTHVYNDTSGFKKIFSTFLNGELSAEHHQKYIVDTTYFDAATSDRGRALWMVSEQMYYIADNDASGGPININFKAYAKNGDNYIFWSNILEDYAGGRSDDYYIKVELYREDGDIDYAKLANNTYTPGGELVATFDIYNINEGVVAGNGSEYFRCMLRNDTAIPSDTYFYPWAGESSSVCHSLRIEGVTDAQGSSVRTLSGGALYSVKIKGGLID